MPQANTACGRAAAAQLSALTKGGLRLEQATTYEQGVVRLTYRPGLEGAPVTAQRETFTDFLT